MIAYPGFKNRIGTVTKPCGQKDGTDATRDPVTAFKSCLKDEHCPGVGRYGSEYWLCYPRASSSRISYPKGWFV